MKQKGCAACYYALYCRHSQNPQIEDFKVQRGLQILLWLFFSTTSLFAQFPSDNSDVLTLGAFLSTNGVRPGDSFRIGIRATLHNNWHINSNTPNEEFLIPTNLTIESADGVSLGTINYPKAESIKLAFSETPLSVYTDTVLFWVEATAAGELAPGERHLKGTLKYQACNDMTCLIPTEAPFDIVVPVVAQGQPIHEINAARFDAAGVGLSALEGERSGPNQIDSLIAGKGVFLTLVFIFVGGLALNLTPCVYPIIPITISFFVGQSSGKLSKSVGLATLYVLGMSVTYSILGVMAAMTGGLLGSSLQNPIVLVAISAVFLVFAASMFGAFEIRIPTVLNRMAGGSRHGYVGAAVMGLTVGIVAAPCIGPFVLSLLTYVAAQGDPFMGFLMFFVLSLGLGLPYFLLGTFSSSLDHLPKSGMWMVWVKKVFGVIMVAVAIYFLNTLLPELVYISALTATLVLGGLFVGFRDTSYLNSPMFKMLKHAIGSFMILVGAWTTFSAWHENTAPEIAWQGYDAQLVSAAASQNQPVLIDFYADWCIPCKQIEMKLFRAPLVVEQAEQFLSLKADLTAESSPEVVQLRKRYGVQGVPTVILLNTHGQVYRRFTDELINLTPREFVGVMNDGFKTAESQPVVGAMTTEE